MTGRTASAIAFIAGAATVLAFAPVRFYPLAGLTFAVLIHLWSSAAPRRAAWTGFWFGLGLFGAGVSWVYVSLHRFGGMPAPLAAIATLGFCAFLALFPALAGWLQARIPARNVTRAVLLVPAAWTLVEWLRSWIFTGFPWLSAGYAAVGSPLQGYGPVLGVFGLSFLTVSLAGMAWAVAVQRRMLLLIPIVVIVAGGAGLAQVRWSRPIGAPLRAALLQGNVEQDLKFRPERYLHTLQTYARLVEGSTAQLVILPETALPRFYDAIEPDYLARLEASVDRRGGELLLGVPVRAAPGEYYNAVVTLGSASRQQAYLKHHLVPFGEFVPPAFGWVLDVLHIPMSDFSRGATDQLPLEVAGQRVAVNVCYEDAFGDEIAARARQATLLVNVSNVAWFGDSLAPAQHLQIAQMRAIETGRMHLAATNTGITAAIDRDGRVLARLPQFTEGRLEVAVRGYTGTTPYVVYRDWPVVVISLLALTLAAFIARRAASR